MVKVGQFCKVKVSSLSKYGVQKGDKVYLAGDFQSPIYESDPYVTRRLFIAARVIDDHISDTPETKPFTINGLSLTPVDEAEQARLQTILESDFKPKDKAG